MYIGPRKVACGLTDVIGDVLIGEGDDVTLKTHAGTPFTASITTL